MIKRSRSSIINSSRKFKQQRSQSRSRDRKAKPTSPDVVIPTIPDQQPPPDSGTPPMITSTSTTKKLLKLKLYLNRELLVVEKTREEEN